jgi:hypothetical protein
MCESRLEKVSAVQLSTILWTLLIFAGCGVASLLAAVAFR